MGNSFSGMMIKAPTVILNVVSLGIRKSRISYLWNSGKYRGLMHISYMLLFVISCLTMSNTLAQTVRTADYFLSRAINSLTNNNLDAAEKHFQAARDAQNDSADINLKIGELLIQYGSNGHSAALPYLDAAIAIDPSLLRAKLLIGQAYFIQESFPEAEAALEPLLDEGEFDAYARYYLGLIDYRQSRYDRARDKLTTLISDENASGFHESAQSYLDAIDIATKRWTAYGVATIRYDSSPQIISDDEMMTPTPDISMVEDYAFITQAQGSYKLLQSDTREVKASYQLYDIRYENQTDFDQQGHIVRLGSHMQKKDLKIEFDYALEFWTVNSSKYARTQRISTSAAQALTSTSESRIGYSFSYTSYAEGYDDPTRSAPGHGISLSHLQRFSKGWLLQPRYSFQLVDTDQVDESEKHRLSVDIYTPRYKEFQLQLGANYQYTKFPLARPDEHHDHEKKRAVSASITRPLSKVLGLRLSANYEDNRSDLPKLNYHRNYFDVGISASF